jgi:hypothetical protein
MTSRIRAPLSLVVVFVAAAACHIPPVNTVPAPLAPDDPVTHYEIEIPDALEVKAVSFDATTFGDVAGNEFGVGTQVGGRAFLKVYAVHRKTGDQYFLIYEDIVNRKTPVQVIRFRPVPDSRMFPPGSS